MCACVCEKRKGESESEGGKKMWITSILEILKNNVYLCYRYKADIKL